MTNGQVLAEVVRAWAGAQTPDRPSMADRVAVMAERAYEEGASVVEACRQAQELLRSWSRHPSVQPVGGPCRLRLAS